MVENTLFLLMAEYNTADIPLTECCEKYFGLDESMAKKRAKTKQLPVPAYKTGSQKSPWLISAITLAKHIDEKREEAATVWELLNS